MFIECHDDTCFPYSSSTWEGLFHSYLLWAAKDPYTFLFYVLLFLSPFFLVSALLSYKLSKAIEKQDEKVAEARAKAKRRAKKED